MKQSLKCYVVVLDSDHNRILDNIVNWCFDMFGQPAMPMMSVTPTRRWSQNSGAKSKNVFIFYYKDDATLFKLSWL